MEKKQHVDFIIVGQGLAGSLLSYFLLQENQRVVVLDYPHKGTSTKVAAGLVNPITGRRLAKSWRFEEFSSFAKHTYLALEEELGVKIWNYRNIVRALHSVFEENEWVRRSGYPEFQPYLNDTPTTADFEDKMQPPQAWGELVHCAQVSMPAFIEAWKKLLVEKQAYVETDFDYQHISLQGNKVSYGKWIAEKIIFCEGAKATENPFFKNLPFLPTKGELLLIRVDGLPETRIYKQKLFLVPIGSGLFWAGSTTSNEFDDANPTVAGNEKLNADLKASLTVPFEIVAHLAGIRPTVSDLRPFLGLNAQFPEFGIFNGLGTKGALMGPFFAKQMADFLLGKGEIEPEVDIERFELGTHNGHFFTKLNS
ncbi:MAG: FAD-dependent oxidoreductase [Bacteroidetes bacterium]|nr:FAD-dependent oxidoreductase [Bacteroidota bacterium]